MKNKVFDIASMLGIITFFAMLVILFMMFVMEERFSIPLNSQAFVILRSVAIGIVALFAVSTFILWIGGWVYVFREWERRAYSTNLLMILFLILGTGFAAYLYYFLDRKSWLASTIRTQNGK